MHKKLRSAGLSKERISFLLSELLEEGKIRLQYRQLGVDILILSEKREAENIERKIRLKLGDAIYGENEETLEKIVGYLLSLQGLSLAVAESCTGGLVMDRLTSIPGSSQYFKGGVVAYSNEVKIDFLGVPEEIIKEKGAVNQEVAGLLAEEVARLFKAEIGLGIVGIAGPGGGSKEHPVGEVFIGLYKEERSDVWCLQVEGNRQEIKAKASQAALDILRRSLLQ